MTRPFVLALLASCVLSWFARGLLAKARLLDQPNARSSHTVPTVRGGGVAFVFTTLVAMVVLGRDDARLHGVAACAALLAAVSFHDDRVGVGVRARLAVHALVAAAPTAFVWFAFRDATPALAPALALAAFVGTVGYTNAFNFMDGIDGIATLHAAVASLHLATSLTVLGHGDSPTAAVALVVAGASLGFLPFNFPAARMFMGDVGSAFLGYVLACCIALSVASTGLEAALPLLLVHAGFVLDTSITLVRRAIRGERLVEAHREHFYQRFVRSGHGHPRVTLVYTTLTAASGLVGFATLRSDLGTQAAGAALCVTCWLAAFIWMDRRFERRARSGELA